VESSVEPEDLIGATTGWGDGGKIFVERDEGGTVLTFLRAAAAGRADKQLTHGPGGDAFEVQRRFPDGATGPGHFQPSLVDEGCRAERRVGVRAANCPGEAAEFFVGGAEGVVEFLPAAGPIRKCIRTGTAHAHWVDFIIPPLCVTAGAGLLRRGK